MEIEAQIPKIKVCIRKRPLTKRERNKGDKDIITVKSTDQVYVKEQKVKLDLTKYVEEHCFKFDTAYNEETTNRDIYESSILPIVNFAIKGGKVSCFAYGQTGKLKRQWEDLHHDRRLQKRGAIPARRERPVQVH